jgi:hypothetical protein
MCDFTNFVDGRFYAYFGALSGKNIGKKYFLNNNKHININF